MRLLEYISYLKTFVDNLSWKRLFVILTLVLFSVFLLLLTELAKDIFFKKDLPMPGDSVKLLNISREVKKDLREFNSKFESVVGIQIVTLNFQRNIRVETYTDIDNPVVSEVYNSFISRRITDTPIFDNDSQNNSRMVKILNGEFNCVPYNKSKAYTYAPQLQNYISDVCALSIPPYNHEITGIMTVYFQTTPTPAEKEIVFLFLRNESQKIYEDSRDDLYGK